MDEVQGLVTLNGVAVMAVLTLAVLGSGSVLAAAGIVAVAIAGTAGLVVVAEVRAKHDAELHRAQRATDAALLSRQTMIVVDDHCSRDWLTAAAHRQIDAMQHRSSVGIGPTIEVRQPSLFIGNGFTEHVDHEMGLRLASPSAYQLRGRGDDG